MALQVMPSELSAVRCELNHYALESVRIRRAGREVEEDGSKVGRCAPLAAISYKHEKEPLRSMQVSTIHTVSIVISGTLLALLLTCFSEGIP